MDFIRENAKAIAGAATTLVCLLLKPLLPPVADPAFQPALEILITALIVAATVWLVPNKPKGDASPPPTGMDDRKPAPPIAGLLFAVALLPLILGACTTSAPVSPAESFSRACSSVGEAMAQVVSLRRQGKIDDATFVRIDDAYDAAVAACQDLPAGDTAEAVAMEKINAFLLAATNATGSPYQY